MPRKKTNENSRNSSWEKNYEERWPFDLWKVWINQRLFIQKPSFPEPFLATRAPWAGYFTSRFTYKRNAKCFVNSSSSRTSSRQISQISQAAQLGMKHRSSPENKKMSPPGERSNGGNSGVKGVIGHKRNVNIEGWRSYLASRIFRIAILVCQRKSNSCWACSRFCCSVDVNMADVSFGKSDVGAWEERL